MLLFILKIILKIILFLLLAVLLLVLLLLFMRLKYSLSGKYHEKAEISFVLTFLFGLFKLSYNYGSEDDGLKFTLPFGIGSKKKKEIESKAEDEEFEFDNEYHEVLFDEENQALDDIDDEFTDALDPDRLDPKDMNSEEPVIPDTEFEEEPEVKPKKHKQKKKKKEKDKNIFVKLQNSCGSIYQMNEKYDFKLLLKYLLRYVKEQLLSIGVKGGSVTGELGLGDPSQTGLALGGIGAAQAFLPLSIGIDGNFAEKIIDVEGEIHGITYIGKLLKPILRLFFTKPVLLIVKDILFKKGDKK